MRLIAARGLPRVGVDDSDISTAEVVGQIGPYAGLSAAAEKEEGMRAVRLYQYHQDPVVAEVPAPTIAGPLDVIVKIGSAGVCGNVRGRAILVP